MVEPDSIGLLLLLLKAAGIGGLACGRYARQGGSGLCLDGLDGQPLNGPQGQAGGEQLPCKTVHGQGPPICFGMDEVSGTLWLRTSAGQVNGCWMIQKDV